jgi:hypothetical protein
MSIAMYKVEEIRKDNKKKVVEFLKKKMLLDMFLQFMTSNMSQHIQKCTGLLNMNR